MTGVGRPGAALAAALVLSGCGGLNMDQLAAGGATGARPLLSGPSEAASVPGAPVPVPAVFRGMDPVAEHQTGWVDFMGARTRIDTPGFLLVVPWPAPGVLRLERFAGTATEPYETASIAFATTGEYITQVTWRNPLDGRIGVDCVVTGGVPAPEHDGEAHSFQGSCGAGVDLTGSIVRDRVVEGTWRGADLTIEETTTTLELTGSVTGSLRELNDVARGSPFALRTVLDMHVEQQGLRFDQHLERWATPIFRERP